MEQSSPGFKVFLLITAALSGALVMAIEVLGARAVAPFFGVSLFVWTALIAVTLLAQTGNAGLAGALAAYAHGRAAHLVSARDVRGYTLDDVLLALPVVWSLPAPMPRPPVLAELPAVGEPA